MVIYYFRSFPTALKKTRKPRMTKLGCPKLGHTTLYIIDNWGSDEKQTGLQSWKIKIIILTNIGKFGSKSLDVCYFVWIRIQKCLDFWNIGIIKASLEIYLVAFLMAAFIHNDFRGTEYLLDIPFKHLKNIYFLDTSTIKSIIFVHPLWMLSRGPDKSIICPVTLSQGLEKYMHNAAAGFLFEKKMI